jgi:hypothetical protein
LHEVKEDLVVVILACWSIFGVARVFISISTPEVLICLLEYLSAVCGSTYYFGIEHASGVNRRRKTFGVDMFILLIIEMN